MHSDDIPPAAVGIDPAIARRITQTLACRDTDVIPKVENAGAVYERDGVRVQRMFNGVEVLAGAYYGELITPIITGLRGHHEPQEERVVFEIMKRLTEEQSRGELDAPVCIEPGAFWSYYSIWFCVALANARALALEPDPAYLEVGRRNATINGLEDAVRHVQGVVSSAAGATVSFSAESDGRTYEIPVFDLRSMMELCSFDHVDVLYCDIQGHELELLEGAESLLATGSVRFLVVSTHHLDISGSAVTHQDCLALLKRLGAHVIAEHTVSESASGDGLIAVSFDARDRDLLVPLSHVRARDSLFGEVEYALEHHRRELADARQELDRAWRQVVEEQETRSRVVADLASAHLTVERLRAANKELAAKLASVTPPRRSLVARLRSRSR